jgi:hypothetical protein
MIRAVTALLVIVLSIAVFTPRAPAAEDPATTHAAGEHAAAAHAPTTGAAQTPAHAESDAAHGDGVSAHHDDVPHPTKSKDADWAGVVIIIVLGMFLAAAVIGPIVRANAPEEVPPAHSHDEPPGASHHHGHSGQLNPVPESDLGHGHGHGHGGHH